jgi:hypothetical protein
MPYEHSVKGDAYVAEVAGSYRGNTARRKAAEKQCSKDDDYAFSWFSCLCKCFDEWQSTPRCCQTVGLEVEIS